MRQSARNSLTKMFYSGRRIMGQCLLLAVFAGLAMRAGAQTCDYTVTTLADSGTGSLRDGLATAPTTTDICFGVTGTITLASPLQITAPVTITGSSGVTISGNNQVPIFTVSTYAPGVVRAAKPTPRVTSDVNISQLTLTGGYANAGNNIEGGAIWVQYGSVTLSNMTITGNTAQAGGGVYNQGTLTIQDSTISNNTASNGLGGGIVNNYGTLSLVNTVVSGNSSAITSAGGLENTGTAAVTGGTFQGNSAHFQGGAIFNDQYYASLSISGGTTFSGNTAGQDAGAIYNSGTASVTAALFDANQSQANSDATACGGAICNQYSLTVTESTFTANTTTGNGGGIDSANGTLTLQDSTFAGNSAGASAGGVYIYATGAPVISNTVIAGNTAGAGAANADYTSNISYSGSGDFIGEYQGTANLGPLANNGGPTLTMMPLPGGNLVGLGIPSASPDETDQRGFSRFSAGGGIDIGAVQSHYSSVSYLTPPSNTLINQPFSPTVAVQVVETDGSTTNYPQGVPVMVTLLTDQGAQTTNNLSGTATQLPTLSGGVTAARFPDLSVNAVGSYELFATDAISGNSSSADPAYSATSAIFQISQPTVVTLQWQPANATYGPLPAAELNASATINGQPATGTFVYTFVASGATINVGQTYPVATYPVQVVFTPTGSTNQYTLQTALQVTQATPALNWPAPAAIYTSTALSGTQLDASATGVTGAALPGTFVYNPPAGTMLAAGPHTLSTTFTPSDTADYSAATAQVTIQVNAVTAGTIAIQESANPITFGQGETFTAVVKGTDGSSFSGGTAAFAVDSTTIGSAPVANGTASVSDAAVTAGTHQITLTYTNTATNQTLTSTATLTVNKATPTLAWPTPAAIYTSTALSATQLDATATGVTGAALPGTFAYNPAAGTTLTAGPHVLNTTFTPTDATDYVTNTAQVTIQVNAPSASTVAIQDSANPITFGQSETFTATVTGTDGNPLSGGTATFTVDGTAVGSAPVANGSAAVTDTTLAAGTHAIGVTYTNTTTNQTLTGTGTLTVNKATPKLTWSTPAAIYTSTALSATQLDATATGVTGAALAGTFAYNPAAGTTLTAGPHVLNTTFTPTDATDYVTNTAQVTIQVNAPSASTVVIQESANPITFGQSETFTATVTGTDGNPLSGGTAAFTVDNIAIGSAPVANGSAAVTDAALTAGTHAIGVTYTNPSTSQTLTGAATLTVNKAVPKLTWATPAAIYTSTPLSATQLNATASGVTGAALAGSFAYNPAAGTTLTAGAHLLNTTFTPSDALDYASATAQVTLQVNAPTAGSIAIQQSANPITFGQSETFTAVVTGSDGKPFSGGNVVFTVDGVAAGSSPVANGSATLTDTTLAAGTHQIGVTYTSTTNQTLTGSTTLTVNKATPKVTWATPAAIYTSTPLSATQLDAGATGVTNAALAGTFVYTPAAGTTLTAGSHVLNTTFTPKDATDYLTSTAQVTIQVTAPTAATVVIEESANPITFGQSETFTAVVTGSDGKPLSGGTAAFTADAKTLGSIAVVNGKGAFTATSLTAGTHQIGVTYTNTATKQTLTSSATLNVNKAVPVIAWATPGSISTVTPLSATQLNATAKGITGASLPGTFAYSPAAGTLLSQGPHVLSTTFTPNDKTDYSTATAQVTIAVGYAPLSISAASPSSTVLSANPITVVITGSGFTPTSVALLNGSPLPTVFDNANMLTATIAPGTITAPGAFKLDVYDSTSKLTSNVVTFAVTAPAADVTVTVPPETTSGEQPTISVVLNSPYPTDLAGTMTLAFSPSGSAAVDDPAVQFATGGRTLTFAVPAGSTATPQVALQTGTVAGTITVTLALTADGVDVTPGGVSPITLVIAPAAPVITSVTFTNDGKGQITVVVNGFSNTRDVSNASFVFTGTAAAALGASTVSVPATDLFTPWYTSADSDAFGSEFTYTQTFKLSRPDPGITGVSVTLTNSIGTSGSVDSQ